MSKPLVGILAVTFLLGAVPSHATLKIQKEAKEAKFPATNCLYCHNEKLPTKAKTTHNERGTFLVKMKEEKKAKEVDVAWLKEFVEKEKK